MSRQSELAALGRVADISALSNRNLIINGGMTVAQRGTSATAAVNTSYSTVDRFEFYLSGGGAYTTEQSTGHLADTGHDTALKISVTTADTSIASGDYYSFLQKIEAQNLQQLQYGTSSAKEMTLSFWVRATKTGTQTVFLTKNDATSYNFVQEYTINQSDTWEYKTIKIPALTASGITNDNGLGIQVGWILKYGSTYDGTAGSWTTSNIFTTASAVNNMDSASNTFYLTGVQLEVGETATEFEHRSYGDELQRCQRYFEKREYVGAYQHISTSTNQDTTTVICDIYFNQQKRTTPTLSGSAANTWRVNGFANDATAGSVTFNTTGSNALRIGAVRSTGTHVAREASYINVENISPYIAYWQADAEL